MAISKTRGEAVGTCPQARMLWLYSDLATHVKQGWCGEKRQGCV